MDEKEEFRRLAERMRETGKFLQMLAGGIDKLGDEDPTVSRTIPGEKILHIREGTHKELTTVLGELTSRNGEMKTYDDVLKELLQAYNRKTGKLVKVTDQSERKE